jgi:predicted dithiol-disulfide oxidoreductase (DUF899 family)
MKPHLIVSREEWLSARKALLIEEKKQTRARDELARQRRELPWVRIEKSYVFDGPNGREGLGDLFAGRSQLVVQHFMFGPDWEEGCVGCSFGADHVDAARQHFEQRDVSFVAVAKEFLCPSAIDPSGFAPGIRWRIINRLRHCPHPWTY